MCYIGSDMGEPTDQLLAFGLARAFDAPLSSVTVRSRNSRRSAALSRLTGRDPRRLRPLSNRSADLGALSPAPLVTARAARRTPGITIASVFLILALAA